MTNTTSGLPSDDELAARIGRDDAERKEHAERMAAILPAFRKLAVQRPSEHADLSEKIAARWDDARGGTIDLTLEEVERIAGRIADLNQMVMAGALVSEEAELARQVAEVEAIAAVRKAAPQRPTPDLDAERAAQVAATKAAIKARGKTGGRL